MELKKNINNILNICMSVTFGGLILYWMYRGFDFDRLRQVLLHEMNWTWMLLSFPFGISAQLFRGWRWRLSLEPMGESPRLTTSVNAVFLSYASSLVVPRIGEFLRCGVLKRYDSVTFSKALGTVVVERAIDSLLIMTVTALTLIMQIKVFDTFFAQTGTNLHSTLSRFTPAGYAVTALCAAAACIMAWIVMRRFAIYNKVLTTFKGIWQGIMSVRQLRNVPLYVALTLGIWMSYFLHYYLTFFCFESTCGLGIDCALVTFIVGSIAVIVPTPNGAGPWHFAVKTMLILYGVADNDALNFVLIVHSIQTLLVVGLGLYSCMALAMTSKRT